MLISGNMRNSHIPKPPSREEKSAFQKNTPLSDRSASRPRTLSKLVGKFSFFTRFVVPVGTLALVSINFCCKKEGLEFIKPEYLPFFKGATFVSICILLDEIPSFFLPNNKSLMKTFFDNLEKKLEKKKKEN